MTGWQILALVFFICSTCSAFPLLNEKYWMTDDLSERRLSVVFLGDDWDDKIYIFRCSLGKLQWTVTSNAISPRVYLKVTWTDIETPQPCLSNPVTLDGPSNTSYVLYQDVGGQVFGTEAVLKSKSTPQYGKWFNVGGTLPFSEGHEVYGYDSLIIKEFQNKPYIFARSQSNNSNLCWSTLEKDTSSSKWKLIGGTKAIPKTDVAVAYNSFTKLMDAFMVGTDGYLYRTWQLSFDRWADWDKTGYSAPKSVHAPIVHQMGYNIFNGKLNVFVHGTDGKLHHISQTTCDGVPNPWGWCTWGLWHSISGDIPANSHFPANSLSIGNNLHLGIEVFSVDGDGQLNRIWQMQRAKDYSPWEHVTDTKEYKISSLPAIVNDASGWWSAYSMDSDGNLIIVNQDRKMTVTPSTIASGSDLTVTWNMPKDEASNKDWIGIYPQGVTNRAYVDYVYVGGTQNPMSEIITDGSVKLKMVSLPTGTYDIRYLVDKRYVAASSTTFTVTNGPAEEEWVQIFRGIFKGLNISAIDVKTCVKDATNIPVHFKASFQAFEDRAIFKGLQLMGAAIHDVTAGMNDCGVERAITGRIKTFAMDMMACVDKGSCVHFFVDIAKELLVLYENVYEIYGDIRGASNSFDYKFYAQGGVNIGRVINACIELPR